MKIKLCYVLFEYKSDIKRDIEYFNANDPVGNCAFCEKHVKIVPIWQMCVVPRIHVCWDMKTFASHSFFAVVRNNGTLRRMLVKVERVYVCVYVFVCTCPKIENGKLAVFFCHGKVFPAGPDEISFRAKNVLSHSTYWMKIERIVTELRRFIFPWLKYFYNRFKKLKLKFVLTFTM